MPSIKSIHIYPIKSLGGISVESAKTSGRGFEHDRGWMLVDDEGLFLTQREHSDMVLFRCSMSKSGFVINHADDSLEVPFSANNGESIQARIWSSKVQVLEPSGSMSTWFSERLNRSCHLVYMPETSTRQVNPEFADAITALTDGYPYLIANESSLADLNSKLDVPVPMNRFRPNIVINGLDPWEEDEIASYKTDDIVFEAVKPCSRCVVVTTDQDSGVRSKEPLRTLSSFRKFGNHVNFGINAICADGGTLRTGEKVFVK